MDQHEDDLICVGHVLGAQGLKGWIRIYSNTSPRENIVSYSPWLIEQGGELKPLAVKGRLQGKNVLAKLEGIDDRTEAEALTGCQLFIRRRQLPGLEAGEFYWSELIGLTVETLQAEPLGVVSGMLETGADDVMVLQGERERLIPFVMDDIVREVDLARRRLVVDWSPDY
jgi:16S rRNA processing protein RimM